MENNCVNIGVYIFLILTLLLVILMMVISMFYFSSVESDSTTTNSTYMYIFGIFGILLVLLCIGAVGYKYYLDKKCNEESLEMEKELEETKAMYQEFQGMYSPQQKVNMRKGKPVVVKKEQKNKKVYSSRDSTDNRNRRNSTDSNFNFNQENHNEKKTNAFTEKSSLQKDFNPYNLYDQNLNQNNNEINKQYNKNGSSFDLREDDRIKKPENNEEAQNYNKSNKVEPIKSKKIEEKNKINDKTKQTNVKLSGRMKDKQKEDKNYLLDVAELASEEALRKFKLNEINEKQKTHHEHNHHQHTVNNDQYLNNNPIVYNNQNNNPVQENPYVNNKNYQSENVVYNKGTFQNNKPLSEKYPSYNY